MTTVILLIVLAIVLSIDLYQAYQDFTKLDAISKKWVYVILPLAVGIWFCVHQFIVGW